jgi:hypothetical protein
VEETISYALLSPRGINFQFFQQHQQNSNMKSAMKSVFIPCPEVWVSDVAVDRANHRSNYKSYYESNCRENDSCIRGVREEREEHTHRPRSNSRYKSVPLSARKGNMDRGVGHKLPTEFESLLKFASMNPLVDTTKLEAPRISFRALQQNTGVKAEAVHSTLPNYSTYCYLDNVSTRRLRENLEAHYHIVVSRLSQLYRKSLLAKAFGLWKSFRRSFPKSSRRTQSFGFQTRPKLSVASFATKNPLLDAVAIWHKWSWQRIRRCWLRWKAVAPLKKTFHPIIGKFFDKWNCYYGQHKLARLTANRFTILTYPIFSKYMRSMLHWHWQQWKSVSQYCGRRALIWRCWRNWKWYLHILEIRRNNARMSKGLAALRWFKNKYRLHNWKLAAQLQLQLNRRRMLRSFHKWRIGRRIAKALLLCMKISDQGRLFLYWNKWKHSPRDHHRVVPGLRIEMAPAFHLLQASNMQSRRSSRSSNKTTPVSSARSSLQLQDSLVNPQSLAMDHSGLLDASISSSISAYSWLGQEVKSFPDPFPKVSMTPRHRETANLKSPAVTVQRRAAQRTPSSASSTNPSGRLQPSIRPVSSQRKSRYDNVKVLK